MTENEREAGGEEAAEYQPVKRPITWRNGGWLLVGLVLVSGLALYSILVYSPRYRGDGKRVESYGFDLSRWEGKRELLVAGGVPRDYFPAVDHAVYWDVRKVGEANNNPHKKFLLPGDLVVGVAVTGGETPEFRAYPINTLRWHGVVNDTVGKKRLIITYDALCAAAAGYEVETGTRWGMSGLVYNANVLLYDREGEGKESLWLQLGGKALSGPKAGQLLKRYPVVVTSWQEWVGLHPTTLVLGTDPATEGVFMDSGSTLTPYLNSDKIYYPVGEKWNTGKWANKVSALVVRVPGGEWEAFLIDKLAEMPREKRGEILAGWSAKTQGKVRLIWTDGVSGMQSTLGKPSLWVDGAETYSVETAYSFWFAWYAQHPETKVYP